MEYLEGILLAGELSRNESCTEPGDSVHYGSSDRYRLPRDFSVHLIPSRSRQIRSTMKAIHDRTKGFFSTSGPGH